MACVDVSPDPAPISRSPFFSFSNQPQSPMNLPLLFIDWDDTLLCSSYLQSAGVRLDGLLEDTAPALQHSLQLLETQVVALLSSALSLGFRIVIVTNAEKDWVQHSTQRFLPAVCPLLEQLQIISARAEFEAQFPDAPQQWKVCLDIFSPTHPLGFTFNRNVCPSCLVRFEYFKARSKNFSLLQSRLCLPPKTYCHSAILCLNVKHFEQPPGLI